MSNRIEEAVAQARRGENPRVVARLASGWLVIGEVQPLAGYCVLLADPIVASLNDLHEAGRARYCLDFLRAGDALLAITGAARINYETLANAEPSLHTHIVPRFADEPEARRREPPFVAYDWATARRFDGATDGPLLERLRRWFEVVTAPPPSDCASPAA